MKQSDEYVTLIEEKLKKFIELHTHLKLEYQNLVEEKSVLNKIVENQKEKLKESEKQINNIITAKYLKNNKETTEAKQKINEILREIDKCVGLLNQ